jgi:DNA mismatch repair ATPase MutS
MSYGNFCARKSGIPDSIIKRAEDIAQKRSQGDPIQSILSTTSSNRYKDIVESFLEFDCANGDIHKFLSKIIEE